LSEKLTCVINMDFFGKLADRPPKKHPECGQACWYNARPDKRSHERVPGRSFESGEVPSF
jgi:hypothetical protein